MKAEKITMKSTICRESSEFRNGTLFRVLFSGIPDYIKAVWRENAEGICSNTELENPMLEMEAVLMPNGDLHDIEIKYYFDDYVEFELEPADEDEMCDKFIEICKAEGAKYPDAYNSKTRELMGDGEWQIMEDKR